MTSPTIATTVHNHPTPTRLDKALRTIFPNWGRRAVQATISARQVKVNGRTVWLASWKVRDGDRLEISEPPQAKPAPPTASDGGFDPAWLIAREQGILAINKPAGLLVHTTRWREAVNLLGLTRDHFAPATHSADAAASDITLFHRLDRDTSGVVLLTESRNANLYLDALFRAHKVSKEYIAVVATPNKLGREGVIDARLDAHAQRHDKMRVVERGGKRAVTRYEVIGERDGRQWVQLWPETGRTHQLRVHLAYLGTPILGDRLYGDANAAPRLLLHAHSLALPAWLSPDGEIEFDARRFIAPFPPDFPPLPQ